MWHSLNNVYASSFCCTEQIQGTAFCFVLGGFWEGGFTLVFLGGEIVGFFCV